MLKKSTVQLREKPLASGNKSLYLDIYNEGKREYVFLKLKILKGVSTEIRIKNKETQLTAEAIRNKYEKELIAGTHVIKTKHALNNSFLNYFKTYRDGYTKKNLRVIHAVYGVFTKFLSSDDISFNQITPKLLYEFKEYLEKNYNGETPSDYLSKFKAVIKHAMREDYFLKDPSLGISIKRKAKITKAVLTPEEIQKLAEHKCGSEVVKKAFLFSCFSGLRFCDVKRLRFDKHFKGNNIQIIQSKTGSEVTIPISDNIKTILKDYNNRKGLVFNLPSSEATNKDIEHWVKRAEIGKKITYHCARHSYGTNLSFYGNDLLAISNLLGHTDLRQTQLYVRIADSQKEMAINKLPELVLK